MAKSGAPSLHAGQVANRSKAAIGARLKQVRHALNLTQEEIAKSIGSPQGTWGQYEAGMRRPSIAVASRLYDRYRISLDFIYLGDPRGLPFDLDQKITWPKATHK
jgi:transcriptional regulator with XRE-family HTH domain